MGVRKLRLEGGSCKGQPATIIGGGPSLKGFDFSRLRNKPNIICINAAFKYLPWADAVFSEDIRFIEKFGTELQAFYGQVIWHCLNGIDPERGYKACPKVTIIRELRDDKYWSTDLSALSFSSNSAVGAINLAEILGAHPIYVLGLDCRAEGLMLENFHTGLYPEHWGVGASQALNWRSDFEHWVYPNCKKSQVINVVNPEYESALECWPKITLNEYCQ